MTDDRTDETEQHPIGPTSLYERMSAVSRGERPPPLDAAAREHLGVSDRIPAQEPRGSVEDAMIAGADPETGESPARDAAEEHQRTVDYVQEQAAPAPPVIETIPPAAPGVTAEMEPAMQPAPELSAPAQPSPVKQEVIEPERAADGHPAPFAARDAGALVNMLENGQLSADVIAALTALTQGMTEIAEATGKRQKGTLTIKINLTTDDTGEAFFVQGDFAVRAPKIERRKTLLWPDEKGHLSPSQPRQKVLFGVRDAGGGPRQIRDATAERRPL